MIRMTNTQRGGNAQNEEVKISGIQKRHTHNTIHFGAETILPLLKTRTPAKSKALCESLVLHLNCVHCYPRVLRFFLPAPAKRGAKQTEKGGMGANC